MNQIDVTAYREAVLIRELEEKLLQLFGQGAIQGTVHTCVGQEFSAIANAAALRPGDFVTSNHRCHGHFISFTKNWRGLLSELLGKKTGVCAGVGSSQHLCQDQFFSNGIQGGMLPVACGFALSSKLRGTDAVTAAFIGEGTFGEGALYEAMNMAALWQLPLLIVCENNGYSQSTPQSLSVAGDLAARARSFGIEALESDTWDLPTLFDNAADAVARTRSKRAPVFHLVKTYRLNPHSKGDDTRKAEEIAAFREIDPLSRFAREAPELHQSITSEIREALDQHLKAELTQGSITAQEYTQPWLEHRRTREVTWSPLSVDPRRQVHLLNEFFETALRRNERRLFIGEDVLSPYGGAFKVARGLSDAFPSQVITTPISEAGVVGLGVGLAITGFKPYVEIMFGDFITLAFDQLVNHASKIFHMYNRQYSCPIVVRTPMGGKRGYGPTHSQTLDKHLVGIDNVQVVALNTLVDPRTIYEQVDRERHPVVVIENKVDYGKKQGSGIPEAFECLQSDHSYPIARIRHRSEGARVTIVTYGGMAGEVLAATGELASLHDIVAEVFVLSQICPLELSPVIESVDETGLLVTLEEGSLFAGLGSEIVAACCEETSAPFRSLRIGAEAVPIPSVREVEAEVLPSRSRIVKAVRGFVSTVANVGRRPAITARKAFDNDHA